RVPQRHFLRLQRRQVQPGAESPLGLVAVDDFEELLLRECSHGRSYRYTVTFSPGGYPSRSRGTNRNPSATVVVLRIDAPLTASGCATPGEGEAPAEPALPPSRTRT